MNNAIKIFITGDFAPTNRVNEVINKGDYHILFNDILSIIQKADITVTNLESPLMDNGTPIAKTGPNLKAPTKSIEALKFAGFKMVTLANNHMMDYGKEGLFSTIRLCENHSIRHIGAGANLDEAKEIQYFDIKGKKLAFINFCENEWSTTRGDTPGCNPLDDVGLYYQIKEAKKNADSVILIIHGGHETYEYPSPQMKKTYRWFVDLGADAVIGHHTHCFSGYEIYNGKPIVYSLGNFVFDNDKRKALWNKGAAAVVSLEGSDVGLELYPFIQCDDEVGVHLMDEKTKANWLEKERKKTEQIQDDTFLLSMFDKFVSEQEGTYRGFLEQSAFSWILAAKRRGFFPSGLKGYKKLLYENIIRTESHREIILKVLTRKK